MYVGDFDKNQTVDQLIAVNRSGTYYPFLSKEVLEKQLPYLKKKFLSYEKMAGLTFDEVIVLRSFHANVSPIRCQA